MFYTTKVRWAQQQNQLKRGEVDKLKGEIDGRVVYLFIGHLFIGCANCLLFS
jgi:hypothetical protein